MLCTAWKLRRPHLSLVALQGQQQLPSVSVPVLDEPVLAHCEGVVRVGHKGHLHGCRSSHKNPGCLAIPQCPLLTDTWQTVSSYKGGVVDTAIASQQATLQQAFSEI